MLIFCQSGEISPNLVTLILHKVTAKKVYNIGRRVSVTEPAHVRT